MSGRPQTFETVFEAIRRDVLDEKVGTPVNRSLSNRAVPPNKFSVRSIIIQYPRGIWHSCLPYIVANHSKAKREQKAFWCSAADATLEVEWLSYTPRTLEIFPVYHLDPPH